MHTNCELSIYTTCDTLFIKLFSSCIVWMSRKNITLQANKLWNDMSQQKVMSIQYHILSYCTTSKHRNICMRDTSWAPKPSKIILLLYIPTCMKSSPTHRHHQGHQNPHPQKALEFTYKFSLIIINNALNHTILNKHKLSTPIPIDYTKCCT